MQRKILKNKPLVEVIFELRWKLEEITPGIKIDPNYRILIGRLYEKVKSEYPYYEQLPTVMMPDDLAGYFVQYRFRKAKDMWPLVQIGPGIITLNDTDNYHWEDFENRISFLINAFYDVYPDADNNIKISELLLRYIDALEFNFENDNIFNFLKENLKLNIAIEEILFEQTNVANKPLDLDIKFSFPSINPDGIFHLRFARGKKKNKDALIWETQVHYVGGKLKIVRNNILEWMVNAHTLVNNWFFKMIEGELLKKFE